VAFSEVIESNIIVVGGTDAPAPISVLGGEYAIDGGGFTNAEGTIESGQSVQLRLMSGDTFGVVSTVTLTIGGVSAEFSVTTLLDTAAPMASVYFPLPVSSTTGQTITVRGAAIDEAGSEIVSVLVGDVVATSTDGFATWQAEVPVPEGTATLQVTTEDSAGNIDPDAARFQLSGNLVVEDNAVIQSAGGMDVNAEQSVAYIPDRFSKLLLAVNLRTGSKVSIGLNVASEGPRLESPSDVVIDGQNNRALVTDLTMGVLAVNLGSGMRTRLAGGGVGSGVALGGPRAIALDSDGQRALVGTSSSSQHWMFFMYLPTGHRTLLTGMGAGSGVGFTAVDDIILDLEGHRALVADGTLNKSFIYTVNLTSGERSVLSGNGVGEGVAFESLSGIALDKTNRRLLAVDHGVDALIAVDLDSGSRTVLSGPGVGSGVSMVEPVAVQLLDNDIALVLDTRVKEVLAVDLITGARAAVRP